MILSSRHAAGPELADSGFCWTLVSSSRLRAFKKRVDIPRQRRARLDALISEDRRESTGERAEAGGADGDESPAFFPTNFYRPLQYLARVPCAFIITSALLHYGHSLGSNISISRLFDYMPPRYQALPSIWIFRLLLPALHSSHRAGRSLHAPAYARHDVSFKTVLYRSPPERLLASSLL